MVQVAPGEWVLADSMIDLSGSSLSAELGQIYVDLLTGQEPLGPDFEAVWADNAAALYDDEPIPQPVQQQAERAARWPNNDAEDDGA